MKTTVGGICIALFMGLYYSLWVMTLPFFVARLFINALADGKDDVVHSGYKDYTINRKAM